VLISGLDVAGKRQNVSALGETEFRQPAIEPNGNQIHIAFVGLSFAPGEVLRYQYKLEGADSDWGKPTEQRTVNYANLAPGTYRFLVRAINSDGAISTTPATITFAVLRPIWQRWWFICLVALSLGAVVFAFYRYRVARIFELANIRARIATDLHDDIGANLTKISILSEVAKQKFGNGDLESANPLSSIARIARESVASMGDIVWAISPRGDSLVDLARHMREHAEEVFALGDVNLSFGTPRIEQNMKLGIDVRRDLFLIYKEAINNAARHGRCANVKILFSAAVSGLSLIVEDDGVGFTAVEEDEGQGLPSMRRRAQMMGGKLHVESGDGRGTTIRLEVPISKRGRRL
jgi:signal transduction histidine kinase